MTCATALKLSVVKATRTLLLVTYCPSTPLSCNNRPDGPLSSPSNTPPRLSDKHRLLRTHMLPPLPSCRDKMPRETLPRPNFGYPTISTTTARQHYMRSPPLDRKNITSQRGREMGPRTLPLYRRIRHPYFDQRATTATAATRTPTPNPNSRPRK